MKKFLILLLVPFVLMCMSATVFASPMQWTAGTGANNHWYEVFIGDALGWDEADTLAETVYNGTGTLASITSVGENTFVSSLVNAFAWGGSYGPWLGGFVHPTDDDWDYGQWTTGEAFLTYQHWASGQPTLNDTVDLEEQWYLHYYPLTPLSSSITWNDSWEDGNNGVKGYVVEWNQNPVPEPTTMLLFGLGLLGLSGVSRKKQ